LKISRVVNGGVHFVNGNKVPPSSTTAASGKGKQSKQQKLRDSGKLKIKKKKKSKRTMKIIASS
jgi:hypothetical protein